MIESYGVGENERGGGNKPVIDNRFSLLTCSEGEFLRWLESKNRQFRKNQNKKKDGRHKDNRC